MVPGETHGLVERDSRGRVAIGKYSDAERFLVHADGSGRIVLEPAEVVPASVQRLLEDAEFVRRMGKAASEPASPLDLDDL